MSTIPLPTLITQIQTCTKCSLHETRTNAVPGYGSYRTDMMFIGEAPGAEEDKLGLPFVGRSGQILQDIFRRIGLAREHIFIANTVKCRPPSNRDPTTEEKTTCAPYLQHQIAIIKPLMIIPLGRISMELFLPTATITKDHGKLHQAALPDHLTYENAPMQNIYPVYHPAYAARGTKNYEALVADIMTLPNILDTLRNKENNA